MTRQWLAGAAAFAMMTGVACAQGMSSDTSTSTQSTTTSTAPAVGSYNSNSYQKSTDSSGNVTDKSSSYHSGAGAARRQRRTRRPPRRMAHSRARLKRFGSRRPTAVRAPTVTRRQRRPITNRPGCRGGVFIAAPPARAA